MTENLKFYLTAIMLLFAPLIAGGKSLPSLLGLELIGTLLLGIITWQDTLGQRLSKLAWFTLFLGLSIPILYLIPIPATWWEVLPGRAKYVEGLNWYQYFTNTSPWLSLSLVPEKTVHALLALIPLLAIFLATLTLSSKNILKLTYLLIILAVTEAILGILNYTAHTGFIFTFGLNNREISPSVSGTYINRDHFSALLYMTLPLTLGEFFYRVGNKAIRYNYKEKGIQTHDILGLLLIITANIFLIIGAVLSGSRAGIFLIVLAIAVSSLLFASHIGGKSSASLTSSLIVAILGISLSIGVIPILNRFIGQDPLEDARWEFYQLTWTAIKQFFPLGTGPSTFQEVYRTLQPYDQIDFLNHVHNDYLELVFEIGLLGVVFTLLFFLVYIQGWLNLRTTAWDKTRFLKVASGISIGLLLIHTLVDFNFHVPANALIFSMLLGIFIKRKEP
ncbi:O-antigen ligase [uncultured Thiothrix sp.]|uniref:O-antigen ligase family protein n=1 Tax=uncultured Thiothrix sp. TaxID=223185 RepID=UPI002626B194|nr:O-antigen ligase family protein [uncultured Thiothrix sp.]